MRDYVGHVLKELFLSDTRYYEVMVAIASIVYGLWLSNASVRSLSPAATFLSQYVSPNFFFSLFVFYGVMHLVTLPVAIVARQMTRQGHLSERHFYTLRSLRILAVFTGGWLWFIVFWLSVIAGSPSFPTFGLVAASLMWIAGRLIANTKADGLV